MCEVVDGQDVLFLRTRTLSKGRLSLLNTHTYSQADFDAVGEVLLCPRPLGLLSLQGAPLARLRVVFSGESPADTSPAQAGQTRAVLTGPSCVTFHPFSTTGRTGFVIQNLNDTPASVGVTLPAEDAAPVRYIDRFSGQAISTNPVAGLNAASLSLTVPPRGRAWVQPER